MLRRLPAALDPGARPVLTCPDDAIAWIRSVDWLVAADRALILHVDADGQLTCVASCWGRLAHLGPLSREAMASEALGCGALGVIAVDLRRRVPARAPAEADRRRHLLLRAHLAMFGVPLLDTIIVAAEGGASVTGVLTFPLGPAGSWLQVHLPERRPSGAAWGWAHDEAAAFLPAPAPSDSGVVVRPSLWSVSDPAG
jgi:hypothetical protein